MVCHWTESSPEHSVFTAEEPKRFDYAFALNTSPLLLKPSSPGSPARLFNRISVLSHTESIAKADSPISHGRAQSSPLSRAHRCFWFNYSSDSSQIKPFGWLKNLQNISCDKFGLFFKRWQFWRSGTGPDSPSLEGQRSESNQSNQCRTS